ncbi:MAG TPA: HAMP domain-containing sensor histidine kinase [Planctomycetota bacterium]|nr:HAMP domain-containing sensor histidine kinase [Planctomycetota bacterium]
MRLGFRARLVLGTTLLVAAFVATAVVVLAVLTGRFAAEQVEREVQDSHHSFTTQMDLRQRSLRRETQVLSRTPVLLATAGIPGVDAATFEDVLDEMQAPVVAVLDPKGRVLASRGGWPAGTELGAMPGFADAMREGTADHVWPHPEGLALVAIAPLAQRGELLGALVRGELVDDALAARIGAIAGRDVVLSHDGVILAQHWLHRTPGGVDLAPLQRLRHAGLAARGTAVELTVDGRPQPGLAMQLHPDGGVAYLSHDLRPILALRDEARGWLLAVGGCLVLLGVAFAMRTAARLSRPLRALIAASDRMGTGDLATRVDAAAMDDELGRLAVSFNSMAQTMQTLVAEVTDKAARADAANRAKDGFLTSMSHELRTPLTGIQSTAELLQQFGETASAAERTEFLTTILRESERLGQRINDALEFANLAGGRTQWTVGRVDLHSACEQACRRLDSLRALKRVHFAVDSDNAVLTGDRERITQAIYQLLHNAWTWSPSGGTVDVATHAVPGGFVVEVRDRGPGIPAHDRERIFDYFTQGGDVLVDKPAGIGIGLKIAAEVAAAHGGGVEYVERPGGGAVFRLLLRLEGRPVDRGMAVAAGT